MSETHKFCSKCGALKPRAEFKRLLSRAQTVARGYAGAYRVEIESTRCKPCQPKAPPLKTMSAARLEKMAAAGDIRPFMMDNILKERNNKDVAARRTKERWDEAYSIAWRQLVKDVSREIKIVRDQQQYALQTQHEARLDYTNTYLLILEKLRARMRINALKPTGAPKSKYWQDHASTQEVEAVKAAYTAEVAGNHKRKAFRQGSLATHKPVPPDQAKPTVRLTNGGETVDSPAARLAQGGEVENPLFLLTNDQLLRLAVTGAVSSDVINVVIEERARKEKIEAMGRADEAFNKRVAQRIAEVSVPTKEEKARKKWATKLSKAAAPPVAPIPHPAARPTPSERLMPPKETPSTLPPTPPDAWWEED